MNFNYNKRSEFRLHQTLVSELIKLYGIQVKLIEVKRIGEDITVFKDYSHLRSEACHELMVLPEQSDTFDIENSSFQDFGLLSFDNITLFVYGPHLDDIMPFNQVVGNLIILPSNKYMEITNIEHQVPGINNMFTYSNERTVYKLTCAPYEFKNIEEVKHVKHSDFTSPDESDRELEEAPLYDYDALNSYFDEIIKQDSKVAKEFNETPTIKAKVNDELKEVPRVDNSQDDIWGQFG